MNGTITNSIANREQSGLAFPIGSRDKKQTERDLRILIVEDHDASRYCLEGLLQTAGYSVCSFPCAEVGLARLEADHFEVLLTDLYLPGINGFDLIAKAKVVQPSIHILMMTAAVDEEVRERALVAGVEVLMAKPLKLDQLLAFLDSIPFCERQGKAGCK